jgi:hypothetical protein
LILPGEKKKNMNAEQQRLNEARSSTLPWKKWGPYLSERQWGTVREDYSQDGNAWNYFTHDQARSRAYLWGEDGLGGISDENQFLCFALAVWNGRDPILKERLFGLSNSEANHGEDVKEVYYYLDSTPTHSYMKYLYKYPQAAYPYEQLVQTNRSRTRDQFEYELIDTGVFDDDRYFDVFVEYAKSSPEDILIRITVANRGPKAADLHLLPTLWFRNIWSQGRPTVEFNPSLERPSLEQRKVQEPYSLAAAAHPHLGERYLYCDGRPALLFTENETNNQLIFGTPNASAYVKDGIHNYIVHGQQDSVNPANKGTKVSPHYYLTIVPGGTVEVRLRLSDRDPKALKKAHPDGAFGQAFEHVFTERLAEADTFYEEITPDNLDAERASLMRQALAGMLWTKQFYFYDVEYWLDQHGAAPLIPTAQRQTAPRNNQWYHMLNHDIISMPDKWEYPWYAAWDLAFHTIVLQMVDPDFAKHQLDLMLRQHYLHPNGQIPAYEWNFSDVNPPVHAWAALFNFLSESAAGQPDVDFLEHAFQKLMLNFTWWVNRKDPNDKNVFDGGFLGLDNIGVFDRSSPLPTGGYLEQADGTAWMAFFAQTMFQMAMELFKFKPVYEDMAIKYFEHFLWIASAMDHIGEEDDEMWDEQDGFFYDLLRTPDGHAQRLKVRSMVGLLPLCAVTTIDNKSYGKAEVFRRRASWFLQHRPELIGNIHDVRVPGAHDRHMLAVLDERKLRRVLAIMLDEKEFLSPYGIRSLSLYHREHPFIFNVDGKEYRVDYLPAESNTGMFGGNSNWRGPVWMPVNALIVRALLMYYNYYGDDFTIECPTGSGVHMNLYQVAEEVALRLERIFLRDKRGRRPVFGDAKKYQQDPHWRDHILFYEYFHGDNGAGLGASHQTGWTGLVAKLVQLFAATTAEEMLASGRRAAAIYQE